LGLTFDAVDMPATLARLRAAASGGSPCFLSTPNLNFLIASQQDAAFRGSVINSDLSIADGMPLIWIARLLGLPLGERVAGSSLFEELCRDTARPLSVYFFGAPPGVAERAAARLNAEARGLRCVGFECPGFGSVEEMSSDAIIERINASGADFVVVALGARKGQEWIERNRRRIAAPVVSHLGAVIGFVAGTVKRAPVWMQRNGMEWLWRIKEEPQLWRRYFGDGLILLRLLATRVLPLAVYLRLSHPRPEDIESAAITKSILPNRDSALALRGAWTADNLEPLRTAFVEAAKTGTGIRLDLGAVTYMDSGAIGLMMLLHGDAAQRGRTCAIDAATDPVWRLLELSGAGFLLSPLVQRRNTKASPKSSATSRANRENRNASPPSRNGNIAVALTSWAPARIGRFRLGAIISVKRVAFVLAAVMCTTSIGAIVARPGTKAGQTGPAVQLESMVPKQFDGWREDPQAISRVVNPQAKELLDKLYRQILTRTYVNAEGYRIMLTIAYGDDQRGDLQAHKPEVCYPAQGFTLQSLTSAVLTTDFGIIPATRLLATMGPRKEPVTYWFTVGDSAVQSALQKRVVEFRYGLTGQIPDGMLFRVSSIDDDSSRAYGFQEQFVVRLLESVSPTDRIRLSGLSKLPARETVLAQ
jgi:N-acetylglucosaminyldiphosphoundecaprenol N-acetyl-beta-D-mannosaminyltransferase